MSVKNKENKNSLNKLVENVFHLLAFFFVELKNINLNCKEIKLIFNRETVGK